MLRFFGKRTQPRGSVSILIPTIFDSRYIIELCIKSIIKYTEYPDYKIIVGDSGVDSETFDYLSKLESDGTIKLIKVVDWERPKDELVKHVETDFYMLMHDDIRITHNRWIENRLSLINRNENNAIVGKVVRNSGKYQGVRFFPLGLLVRTEASRQMNLVWGKRRPDFDTGFLAYRIFNEQNKYKFVDYKVSKGIYHFAEMGWPQCPYNQGKSNIDEKKRDREMKILAIRDMLDKGKF